jgi:uncharacterized protein YndB with AHSA1/START domain
MTERSVTHSTFVLERTYAASPSRVFAAWAEPEAKARWFGNAGGERGEWELDFRVGGRETSRGAMESGTAYSYDALYQDIVQDERIVYTYDMHLDGRRISVSVATVELKPEGEGTRLVLTEQGAFLDGLDSAEMRQSGTGGLLDALGKELAGETAQAG